MSGGSKLLGPLGELTVDQLNEFASVAEKDPTLSTENRMVLSLALRTAARWRTEALAYNTYLASDQVREALLARKLVCEPKIEVDDRRDQKRGFAVVIRESDTWSNCIGDGYKKDVADRVANMIREYGDHVAERTRQSMKKGDK